MERSFNLNMKVYYLPPETTQEQIRELRERHKELGEKIIIVISGSGDLKLNLKDFIAAAIS